MKKISISVIVLLFLLTSFTFVDAQGLTYGRDKLKGTDKTMGDYKPTTPTTTKRLICSNCVCDCTVPDTTSTAPPTTPATGMGTTGGGGTSRPK